MLRSGRAVGLMVLFFISGFVLVGHSDPPEAGIVRFESTPPGAAVMVEGRHVCNTAGGGCNRVVPMGRRTVSMALKGYETESRKLTLTPGLVIHWNLQANHGFLNVITDPPDLGLALDGRPLGESPLEQEMVTEGAHEIVVQDRCWLPSGKRFNLARGEIRTVKIDKLKPQIGAIRVTPVDQRDNAMEAEVYVDGRKLGWAPGTFKVPVCSKRIKVVKGDQVGEHDLPELAAKKVVEVKAKLGPPAPGGTVLVPEGWFWMGCNDKIDQGCDPDERPGRKVWLDEYRIDVSEVTIAMYRRCVEAGKCEVPLTGGGCNWGIPGRDDHPANCVNWFNARKYCRWVGGELPSEAQWEKASRGTDGRIWPWGNEPPTCEVAVMGQGGPGCGNGGTMPVCSKPKGRTVYGACDMTGSVMEWVLDPQDASWYGRAPKRNPLNNPKDENLPRCLRGGEYTYTIINFLRSSNRDGLQPRYSNYGIGFRCVR